MKLMGLVSLLFVMVFCLYGCTTTTELSAGAQTTCPISGKAIDKNFYYDYYPTDTDGNKAAGVRIYTCCPGCIDTIKVAPEQVVLKYATQGIQLQMVTFKESDGVKIQPASYKEDASCCEGGGQEK